MIRRPTGQLMRRFSGRLEQLDHRLVLAAMFSMHELTIADPTVEPVQIGELPSEFLSRAAALKNWQQSPRSMPRPAAIVDVIEHSIDIAPGESPFHGNAEKGAAQQTTGTLRGTETGTLATIDIAVIVEPNTTITRGETGPPHVEWDRVELPTSPAASGELPTFTDTSTSTELTLPPSELTLESPLLAPPAEAPPEWDLFSDGAVPTNDLPVEVTNRPTEDVADRESELQSTARSGLTIRQPLEAPVESDEAESEPAQVSDWSLGVDLVWMSRAAKEWRDEGALDRDGAETAFADASLVEPMAAADALSIEQRQGSTEFHAGRLRPTVEWQDTGDLTVETGLGRVPAHGSSRAAKESQAATADVRPRVASALDHAAIEFAGRAHEDHGEALQDANRSDSSWMESCLSSVKAWLSDLGAGSWRQLTGELIPAILATVALVRLLENEGHGSRSDTDPESLARRTRRYRAEIACQNSLSSDEC